ncbi:MAG: VWA domain-containing protein, partial [Proteobacteria bacterium]|nr:VWA domain-containing protein [Pseudomonadota bacterium]
MTAITELDMARFCKDEPDLTLAVLKDVLASASREGAAYSALVEKKLRELEHLERERKKDIEVDEKLLRRLRAKAEKETKLADRPDGEIIESWGERARAWAQVHDVFGDLGAMMGRGWDLSRGVLRHTGWQDVVRLQKLIEQLPQVQEIVASLGRLQDSDSDENVVDTIFVAVRRLEEERREVRSPLVPAETRGVERSGSIARMLPSEAALFGHPVGRLLWHARRAERALMTYRVEGVEYELVDVETEGLEERRRERPRPERGPILAIVDTSGSMHGTPEKVAKALVLEALRTAHSEKRRCYLYAYSGPGQVLEHELSLTPEGIGNLLVFLGQSFGGGNDEAGMLAHVLDRLDTEDWSRADVVFVSD